jgi:hypothetical protein
MTDGAISPEDEAKATAREQHRMISAQQDEYGWQATMIDVGDYLLTFVRVEKPLGRTFVMRLKFDDYPEIAPELRFIDPIAYDSSLAEAEPEADFYPTGDHVVGPNQGRGPLPVPCIIGHRDYYAAGWHSGWVNPPTEEHSPYQLVMNVRNAILNVWS